MNGRESTPPFGFFGTLVLALSVGFLGAGFLLPGAAEALLRLFLPALALGFLLTRVYEVQLPRKMAHEEYSPFLHARAKAGPDEAPRVIQERARLLTALDTAPPPATARTPAQAPVPLSIRWLLLDEIGRRLAEHRGLHLANPGHHPAIQALVSEDTWRLVGSSADVAPSPAAGQEGPSAASAPVHLHHLTSILDDLENL